MGGEGKGRGRKWMRRAIDFSIEEGGRVKGVRVGMRR
jgi:hypothetical protein